jgi:hypothetical protein
MLSFKFSSEVTNLCGGGIYFLVLRILNKVIEATALFKLSSKKDNKEVLLLKELSIDLLSINLSPFISGFTASILFLALTDSSTVSIASSIIPDHNSDNDNKASGVIEVSFDLLFSHLLRFCLRRLLEFSNL